MRRVVIGDARAALAGVLLLPGNDLCGEFYRPLGEALWARGVSATLLTLPGVHCEPPLAAPGWPPLVEAVLAEIAAQVEGAGRGCALVGHSLGGLLALLVAARRPPRLERLVLVEPAIFRSRAIARAAAAGYTRSVVRRAGDDGFVNWNGGLRRVADEARFPREMIDLYLEVRRTSDQAGVAARLAAVPELYPLPFAEVAVPALVVRGAEAGWRGKLLFAPLERRLGGAERVTIAGAAHWIANERDEALADAICGFVSPGNHL